MTWIVKDSNGQYYRFSEDAVHWTDRQSEAERFETRESAEKLSKHMNQQYSESRVVKLKDCKQHLAKKPEIGTVFIDQSNNCTPHIIFKVTDYTDHADAEVLTLDHLKGEGTYSTLEEYWDSIKSGEIKVIWEPKS